MVSTSRANKFFTRCCEVELRATREDELMIKARAIAERLNFAACHLSSGGGAVGRAKEAARDRPCADGRPENDLLDEPIAGVNPTLAREIGEHLQTLAAEGLPILLIEHQMDMVARLCDRVIVMAEGRYLTEGSFDEIARDERVQEAYMGRRARGAH